MFGMRILDMVLAAGHLAVHIDIATISAKLLLQVEQHHFNAYIFGPLQCAVSKHSFSFSTFQNSNCYRTPFRNNGLLLSIPSTSRRLL